jgi:hypothetical protein
MLDIILSHPATYVLLAYTVGIVAVNLYLTWRRSARGRSEALHRDG